MRSINTKQYRDQMRTHYNHVSKCDDHHKQSKNIAQSEPCNCTCQDYSVQLDNIENRITAIETNIQTINNNITIILERLNNNPPSQVVGTEETVQLSINPPAARSIVGTETRDAESMNNITPNTVAFDSLLADVEDMNIKDMDEFYNNYISPVIAQNNYNLLAPIPVADLCSCTKIPLPTDVQETLTWGELEGNKFIENKRAYIMQFILANRSNSTRAMYLTNQLIGAFALPL